jgi:hypothetical protein
VEEIAIDPQSIIKPKKKRGPKKKV